MSLIGLFYGSSTSYTEYVAYDVRDMIHEQYGAGLVEVYNVGNTDFIEMLKYDYLILGIPTWDIGELQSDWDHHWEALTALDLSGRKIAIFGLGDQYGYPDTFLDAAGVLAEAVLEQGGELVGYTSTDGYAFEESLFVEDGRFMGLALDEEQQSDLTRQRVDTWIKQIMTAFGISEAAATT